MCVSSLRHLVFYEDGAAALQPGLFSIHRCWPDSYNTVGFPPSPDKVFLCSLGCPKIHSADQAGLVTTTTQLTVGF